MILFRRAGIEGHAHEGSVKKSWFRRAAETLLLGMGLASAGVALAGCGPDKPTIVEKAGVTGSDGKISFDVNGKTVTLGAFDYANLEPIPGLLARLTVGSNGAFYILTDTENRYFPRIFGVPGVNSGQTMGGLTAQSDDLFDPQITRNVFLEKKDNACKLPSYDNIDGGRGLEGIYTDYLEFVDKKTQGKVVNNFLTIHFQQGSENVRLDQLNGSINDAIDGVVSQAGQKIIQKELLKLTVMLGVQNNPALAGVGPVLQFALAAADLCERLEKREWAAYYRSLCYRDEDLFEIWVGKTIAQLTSFKSEINGQDVAVSLAANPIMVVIPKQKQYDWQPQISRIDGTVNFQPRGLLNVWRLAEGTKMQLEDGGGKFPTVQGLLQYDGINGKDQIPKPTLGAVSGTYSFIAGVCGEGTGYKLGVKRTLNPFNLPEMSTALNIRPWARYIVDFHTSDSECNYGVTFRDRNGNGIGTECERAVTCNELPGYVATTGDAEESRMCVPKNNTGCKEVLQENLIKFSESAFSGPHKIKRYGNYLLYIYANITKNGSLAQGIRYANLRTGEIIELDPAQIGHDAFTDASGIWKNQFVVSAYGGAEGGSYIFDMEQKSFRKLATRLIGTGLLLFEGDKIVTFDSPDSLRALVYDPQGKLIETIGPFQGLDLASTDLASFNGSTLILTKGSPGEVYSYNLGSGAWGRLPISGYRTKIQTDGRIVFSRSIKQVGENMAVGFGRYSISAEKEEVFPEINDATVKFDVSGENLAGIFSGDRLGERRGAYVMDLSLGKVQQIFNAESNQKIYDIAIDGREVAIIYIDADKSHVVVCSF